MSRPSQAKARRRAKRKAQGRKKNASYQGVEVPASQVAAAPARNARRKQRAQARRSRMEEAVRDMLPRFEPRVRRGKVD